MSINSIAPAAAATVPAATPAPAQPSSIPVDRNGETLKGAAAKAVQELHHAHAHNHPQISVTATPSTGINTVA